MQGSAGGGRGGEEERDQQESGHLVYAVVLGEQQHQQGVRCLP